MEFRRATAVDMDAIIGLVDRVFYGEQRIPRELHPIPAEKVPCWWCAVQDGQLAGTVALYREEDGWHMGRFLLLPEHRGQKIGTAFLRFALEDIFAWDSQIDDLSFEARDTAVHILQTFGAVATGEPFPFYEGAVTPVRLTRSAFLARSSTQHGWR